MRIIVCVKQIRLTYARTGMDPEQYFLKPEDSVYRVNPYDEAALELALQAKERQDDVEIILLTLGPIIAETELRRCLALGADDIYQIEMDEELDPWSKSKLLVRATKDIGAELVLCGKESLDKQNGQVGALMAHRLDMPFLSAVLDLTIQDNGIVETRRATDRVRGISPGEYDALTSEFVQGRGDDFLVAVLTGEWFEVIDGDEQFIWP